MRRNIFICLLLAGMTLTAFWPVGRLDFILYDDWLYVYKNPNVQAGITTESIRWAFTTAHASNWHPVTWLSHMLDCQLFGLKPAGHHWVSLGFHILNTLLLFVVLNEMTRTVWRSALVAALFALHPLRVESVAWISERKDVLSGCFMLLTLWAYTRYVQGVTGNRCRVTRTEKVVPVPASSRVTCHASLFYGLALVFFALGLMSKPMLVTLPVILLLLDFWPLRRVASDAWRVTRFGLAIPQIPIFRRLLFEKVPFLALSLASSIVTFWAQHKGGCVVSVENMSWLVRVFHPLAAYTAYLGKIFWPENLAIFYPYTPMHNPWELACFILPPILLSVLCIRRARFQPCLFVGWFWFLVMLMPVIGLVQVGLQSIADRYTYLPSIGLFIIVAWGMAGIAAISTLWRTLMTLGAAGLLLACLLGTRNQLGYWQDNLRLFSHTIEVTRENNFEGYLLVGNAFMRSGNLNAAGRSYESALKINPYCEDARLYLAEVRFMQSNYEAATGQANEVLRLNPKNAEAHKCLGDVLAAQDKTTEAASEYSAALQLNPDDVTIREALALILAQQGETDKALACLQEALKIQPTPGAHAQVAAIRARQGEFTDTVEHYRAALRLQPDSPEVLNNLAWLLATCPDARIRDGAQAVGSAERACKLTNYRQTIMVGTLAAAYAEAGRFDDAISTAQEACALAEKSGEQNLMQKNQELLVLYRAHRPYHEAASPDQAEPSAAAHPASGGTEKLVPAAP
ncbi:MAG: tetratricopeptide repeat protein [Verrucomicrobiota bacterium]|jgi:tetratricopeptide (TPR) repeat protein